MFRVIVAGSREFSNYELLANTLDRLLANKLPKVLIVSGAARGADALGERYAKERGLLPERYPADWDNLNAPGAIVKTRRDGSKYNARAGHDRNEVMAARADALVAFWDGRSPGTKDMIEIARRRGLAVRVVLPE